MPSLATTVVTGASSGIGRELARSAAQGRGRLVLVARREAALRALADELTHPGLTVEVRPADLGDSGGRAAFAAWLAQLDRVDTLVSAAGAGYAGLYDLQDWQRIESLIGLNLLATMQSVHAVLPRMIERGAGRILVLGSGAGSWPAPRAAAYVASKFGVHGFCEALRLDLAGTGVHLTESMPGPVDTGFETAAGGEGVLPEPAARTRISARACARDSWRALTKGKDIVYPGMRYKALMRVGDAVPRPVGRRVAARAATSREIETPEDPTAH